MFCPSHQEVVAAILISLQILLASGQLGDSQYSTEDILDIYEPLEEFANATRLVGGEALNVSHVPWQAAIYSVGGFICGGSIISRDWVVTAAQCADLGPSYSLTAGSNYALHRGQFRRSELVVVNSGFNDDPTNNNIALIKVNEPFHNTPLVKPVKLAKPYAETPDRFFVSGWGTTSEIGDIATILKGVTVRHYSRKQCEKRYREHGLATKYMLCAQAPGKDSCQGDLGGPLVYGNVLYGIASLGIGCGRPNYPGIYTNIRRQYLWIQDVIQRYGGQMPTFQ